MPDSEPVSLRGHIELADIGKSASHDPLPVNRADIPEGNIAPQSGTVSDFVYEYLSDLPHEDITAVTEAIKALFNDEKITDVQRKAEVESILEPMSNEKFNDLWQLAQNSGEPLIELSDSESDDSESLEPAGFKRISDDKEHIDLAWLAGKVDDLASPQEVLKVLEDEDNKEQVLNKLFGFKNPPLAAELGKRASEILWSVRLNSAESVHQREAIQNEIAALGLEIGPKNSIENENEELVDLQSLIVSTETEVKTTGKVRLPEGTTRISGPVWEQYNIPPPRHKKPRPEPVDSPANFKEFLPENLNAMQSRVADAVLMGDENILVSAPTGAGKTVVALMAILRCLQQPRTKVVYVSPLKALVQEQVRTFQTLLKTKSSDVVELSGDSNNSRDQLAKARVIIATPEKWDVVSRKLANLSLLSTVGLLVIDEVHLLHDLRGPVIEALVARFTSPRILGLSATLPNYTEVAEFLRVPEDCLFYFGPEYRPVPLIKSFVGVTEPQTTRKYKALNETCVEKVRDYVDEGHQVLLFVHSRKDTTATAELLANELHPLKLRPDTDEDELHSKGVGIHHAGLSRDQRSKVESLFASRKIQVLVSTATLAWGVNLPAHAVIIKGTQYYDPQQGQWTELSPQDVTQMLGRAGRPGFDAEGHGVLITYHEKLNYWLGLANSQLPIESRLIGKITDLMNAEVARGTINSIDDGLAWLGRTFYSVRMRNDPDKYRVGEGDWRRRLVRSALYQLQKLDCLTEDIQPTKSSKIAADFYIDPESVAIYRRQLKPYLTNIDLFRMFCLSHEFSSLSVRPEEKRELQRLQELVPIPVRPDDRPVHRKINVLLQVYICKLRLHGLALNVDSGYVAQSAARIFRALYALSVAQGWPQVAHNLLDVCKMIDHRMWLSSSPFRQFMDCPREIIRKSESSMMPWNRYFDLESPAEIGEALRNSKLGEPALELLHRFPRFELSAQILPISPSVAVVATDISPIFEWDEKYQQLSELFYLSVEDDERIYAFEEFRLPERYADLPSQARNLPFVLPERPYPPFFFVRLVSARWLHSSATASIDFRHIPVPSPVPNTSVIDEPSLLLESDQSVMIGTQDKIIDFRTTELAVWLVSDNSDLSGNLLTDLEILSKSASVRMTPQQWEFLTRFWGRRAAILDRIRTLVCTDIELLGSLKGALMEIAIARTHYWAERNQLTVRYVLLGLPIANSRSFGQWLDISRRDIANCPPHPCQINVFGFADLPYMSQLRVMLSRVPPRVLVVVPDHSAVKLAQKLGFDAVTKKSLSSSSPRSKEVWVVHTQSWDSREARYIDYTATEIQRLIPLADEKFVILCPESRQAYYQKFLTEPIPVESNILYSMRDFLSVEIAAGTVTGPDDALEILSHTYWWTRLAQNPGYYGLISMSSDEYASEIVESSFEELAEMRLIELDNETLEVSPLNGARIAARSMNMTPTSVAKIQNLESIRFTSLLEEICNTPEVQDVTSASETDFLTYSALVRSLPIKCDPSTSQGKALMLLQLWFSRTKTNDSPVSVVEAALDVVSSTIEILIGDGRLAALTAVDMSQYLTQAVWDRDSPLRQLPHSDDAMILRCKEHDINTVHDFLAIEDDALRIKLLGFEDERLAQVANFVNHYPSIDVYAKSHGPLEGDVVIEVIIEREIDEDDDTQVVGPLESERQEGWFLLVGSLSMKQIFGFKKCLINEAEISLEVPASIPSDAPSDIMLWCVCNCYVDADKEVSINIY